ncbi:MAG: hypothetical protein R3C04_04335 [Hyphomonas sp.]
MQAASWLVMQKAVRDSRDAARGRAAKKYRIRRKSRRSIPARRRASACRRGSSTLLKSPRLCSSRSAGGPGAVWAADGSRRVEPRV